MSFKKPLPPKGVKFDKIVKRYFWNENTENFELQDYNIQEEIDTFKGQDLKAMIEKNIYPVSRKTPIYADTTIYNDVSSHDIYNALNRKVEIVNNDEKIEKTITKDTNEIPINDKKDVGDNG